jgi:hypothetical protein
MLIAIGIATLSLTIEARSKQVKETKRTPSLYSYE